MPGHSDLPLSWLPVSHHSCNHNLEWQLHSGRLQTCPARPPAGMRQEAAIALQALLAELPWMDMRRQAWVARLLGAIPSQERTNQLASVLAVQSGHLLLRVEVGPASCLRVEALGALVAKVGVHSRLRPR